MEEKIKGYVVRGLFIIILCAFFIAAMRWIFPAAVPFALGAVIAAGVRPAGAFLSKKLRMPRRFLNVIIIIVLTVTLLCITWLAGRALLREAASAAKLCAEALSDENGVLRQAATKVMKGMRSMGIDPDASFDMAEISRAGAVELTKSAASLMGSIAVGIPSFFLFFAVLVLSVFYFSCDWDGVAAFFERFVSEKTREAVLQGSSLAMRALKRFAKAYLLLFLITLAELFVGFLFLSVKYPLLTALLTALVDLLPIFGVGTVLVPWSVFMLITGQSARGVGFLILFAVIYSVRQFLEPRLVGDAAGVHPVAVLFSVYLGFNLMGVGGLLLAPLLLNGFCVFLEEKRKKLPAKVDKEERKGYNYME